MPLKTTDELVKELSAAKSYIKIGGIYSHYKHPENLYKVVNLAVQEATSKICVIYQSLYNKKLIFIRDLDSWLETPEVEGKKVARFKLIEG